jgi:hypothetical protein
MRKSLTIDPLYDDGLCPTPVECNARRWYGAGQRAGQGCWQCRSYELNYVPRPTMPWVGQVVERSTDKQRCYPRWV